jgi:predicted RNase H-like nuclease
MFVVGVDGCRGGWVAVMLTVKGDWEVNIFASFSKLWTAYEDAAIILVDIPIGLMKDAHGRPCDWLARRVLGPRYRSVFPVPCRPAIYANTYDEAIKINEQLTKKRIFRATWNIVPKIREVDDLLLKNNKARRTVREVHPEVLFWALAGQRPMSFKKTIDKGFIERVQVLMSVYPQTETILSHGITSLWIQDLERDDVLDALAAAVTGLLGGGKLKTLPEIPERDVHGLPMEMVYFMPGR